MKGSFFNQVVTALDEETIVWGISCYKKIGELVDIAELEKMWKSKPIKKNIPQKIRRRYSPYAEAIFLGACLGLTIGLSIMAITIKYLSQ